MKKESFILIILLVFSFCCMLGNYVVAQDYNKELVLELLNQPWDNIHSGELRIAELKVINNTEEVLDGEAIFHVEYKGVCSNDKKVNFEGEGIQAWYNGLGPENSLLKNGDFIFKNFKISKGVSFSNLKMQTHPAICPGDYFLTLTLKGSTEAGEVYVEEVIIGGGGGGYYLSDAISEEEEKEEETLEEEGSSGEVKGASEEVKEDKEGFIKKIVSLLPGSKNKEPLVLGESVDLSEKTVQSKTKSSQQGLFSGLLAAVGMIQKEIGWFLLLIVFIILCLLIKKWWSSRRQKRRDL